MGNEQLQQISLRLKNQIGSLVRRLIRAVRQHH